MGGDAGVITVIEGKNGKKMGVESIYNVFMCVERAKKSFSNLALINNKTTAVSECDHNIGCHTLTHRM